MNYREADDQIFAIVQKHAPDIFGASIKTAYPQTLRALAMFCAKGNSLKTGMFDAVDSNNPYAFRVLYRSFCEHYLRFTYLWVRMSQPETRAHSMLRASPSSTHGGRCKRAQALADSATAPS